MTETWVGDLDNRLKTVTQHDKEGQRDEVTRNKMINT